MNKKLIFLDIDGTLTIPGFSDPPESALEAVRTAQANGHRVFLCTGRNLSMLKPLLAYGFDGAVGSAGGYVFCGDTVLYDHPMSRETRDRVVEIMNRCGAHCILEAQNGAYGSREALALLSGAKNTDSEMARWQKALTEGLGFRLLDDYDGGPVYKIVFISENPAGMEEAERELGEEFFFCRQDDMFGRDGLIHGELINRDFDKGTGVRCICEALKVPLQDTIGFGDSMNDLAMLESVGVGVCMGNGSEKLRAMADYVTDSVDRDGLYKAFVHLGLI